MEKEVPEIFRQRVNKLMAERCLSKKEMAERLDMEYLTFWRKINGKRGVDVVFLMRMAKVLGTSVAYLLGETDSPVFVSSDTLTNDKLDKKVSAETLYEEKHEEKLGRLIFRHGDFCIDIPDTPSNQNWFKELTTSMLMAGLAVS